MEKIWLVDDDHDFASSAKEILVRRGYEVVVFYGARKAIDEAKKQKPDLILMDLMMPELSGEEAIIELKNNPDLAQIPIIILTGLLSPEEYQQMTRYAVDNKVYKTLCKPFEVDELLKLIRESLQRAHFFYDTVDETDRWETLQDFNQAL